MELQNPHATLAEKVQRLIINAGIFTLVPDLSRSENFCVVGIGSVLNVELVPIPHTKQGFEWPGSDMIVQRIQYSLDASNHGYPVGAENARSPGLCAGGIAVIVRIVQPAEHEKCVEEGEDSIEKKPIAVFWTNVGQVFSKAVKGSRMILRCIVQAGGFVRWVKIGDVECSQAEDAIHNIGMAKSYLREKCLVEVAIFMRIDNT